MIRYPFLILVAFLSFLLLAPKARAGAIIESDATDQMVIGSGLNNGYYDTLYQVLAGRLHRTDYGDAVEGFALPYLPPGQQVTGATVSFYLMGVNGSPSFNLQLYGMKRVSTSSSAPIAADYYEGTNDTANTLLAPQFVTPQSTVNSTISYSGANLASFIQSQYANSAFNGMDMSANRYIFLRLSPDGTAADWNNYILGNARNPLRAYHPTLAISISNGISNVAGRLQFSFSLPQASITSAGVYNTSTGNLIRTLWSSVRYQAGMNYGVWDGLDDSGNAVASGTNYQVKLIYHNVQYVWDGTIGNTSTAQTGLHVYRSNGSVRQLAVGGGYVYYALGYDEMFNPFNRFPIGQPNAPQEATQNFIQDPYSHIPFVATDGTRSYWAKCRGGLSGWADTYVISFNADGSAYTFPKGTTPTGANQKYTSCVDFDGASTCSSATGLAVQQSGNALFVSHADKNVVRVFDKVQGSSLGSFTVASAGPVAVTANGDVWVVSNTSPPTISRYTFANGNATLKTTISGLVAPMGLGVSADDSLLLVTDGGTSQQVKAFNNSTGAAMWTYGLAGGMAVNGPNVVNNCFDFGAQSYIAFQPDNTFWVGDTGNMRQMHYSYNGSTVTYVDQAAYIPLSYDVAVDGNNPTRVFNQFLEHSVNYSVPLGGTNGSWTLTKNWAYGLPNDANHLYFGFQDGISSVETLSNGHTYALLKNYVTNKYDLFELPATGFARATGYTFDYSPRIYPDGTMRFNINSSGTAMSFYSMPLTGFDALNNPKWGSPALLGTTAVTSTDPQSWVGTFNERTEVTANGMVVDYDPNQNHTGYHLGAIPRGGTALKWRTEPSIKSSSTDWLPKGNLFDIGNGTQYAGDMAMAMGSNILCGYHGEFWHDGEASQWYDFADNGLMVGRFGTYGNPSFAGQNAVDGYAGNSYSPQLVKVNGQVYLYSNDESNHGGTIRWKINGWENITTMAGIGAIGGTTSLSSASSGPSVTITSPTTGGAYYNGRAVTFSAMASSSSGVAISSVQYFDGSTSLGTATADPYVLNYSGLGTGNHVITALATDASGKTATSAAVSITVGADGTSTPPPAPATLSVTNATASAVTLAWTQPTNSTTSSTTGQLLSFQFESSGDANALATTDVAGATGYAVSNFNLLGHTGTGTSGQAGMVFTNPVNNSGVTISNLGMNLQCVLSNDNNSLSKLTGTALKLFSGEVSTAYNTSVALSVYEVPYGVYDLVVYSQPGNISSGTQTSSVTVSDNSYSTTVNQTFNALQTGYSVSSIGFGSSTSVTNSNTIVIRGLTSTFFKLQGNNIAGFQIVQRPYDQGIPSSYSIERAGSNGSFSQIATVDASNLSYTDNSVNGGTAYQYRVQALNTYGSSPFSNIVSVTTTGTSTASSGTSGSTSSGTTSSGGTSSGSTSSGGTSSGSTSSGGTSSGSTSSGGTSSGSTSSGSTSSGTTPPAPTQTGFQKWLAKYYTTAQLTDPTISGPAADPYGSGVPNLLAYALQLNPATARPTDVPHAEIDSGHLIMTYSVPTAITDVTYVVEVSTDLVTWNSGTGYTSVTSASTSSGTTYTVVDTLSTTAQKHFMRLRVVQN